MDTIRPPFAIKPKPLKRALATFALSKVEVKSMDFYFKYKNDKRVLCSTFRHKGITINMYLVNDHKYVITKNRCFLLETNLFSTAESKFLDSIYLETGGSPELFNS